MVRRLEELEEAGEWSELQEQLLVLHDISCFLCDSKHSNYSQSKIRALLKPHACVRLALPMYDSKSMRASMVLLPGLPVYAFPLL